MSNALDQPCITGFTRPIYSPHPGRVRITLRLMKRWSTSTTSDIGCTQRLTQRQTNYCIQALNRRLTPDLQKCFSLSSARNTTLLTPYFSLTVPTHYRLPLTELVAISDTRNMEIGTLSNVSSEKLNAELSLSRTVSETPQQTQPTTGSDRSASHGTSLSEHYRKQRTKTYYTSVSRQLTGCKD